MVRLTSALAAILLVGCSALVGGPTPSTRRCLPPEPGGPNPCASLGDDSECMVMPGETIGECVSPRPVVPEMCGNMIDDDMDGAIDEGADEVCDQLDNDCDGNVDEEIDLDGDGFAGCVGSMFFVDCDDANPEINPGDSVVEACDGVNNDCDVETVDGSGECAGTQVCQPPDGCADITCANSPALCNPTTEFCDMSVMPPMCRSVDMSCLGSGGPCMAPTSICDPDTGMCVMPQADGETCTTDAMCTSELCVPIGALRLERGDVQGDGVCARTCCRQGDCLGGETCWDSGYGSRFCIPERFVAAGPAAADLCTQHSNCTSPALCGPVREDVHRIPARLTTSCRSAAIGRLSCPGLTCSFFDGSCSGGACFNDRCSAGDQCPTGICSGSRCREPCGSASDCVRPSGLDPAGCTYEGDFRMGRADFIRVCDHETGSKLDLAPCVGHGECQSDTCLDSTGRQDGDASPLLCRAACCNNTHCAPTEQCRPVFLRGRYESVCLPRPMFGAGGPG